MANLDFSGMVGRSYAGDHLICPKGLISRIFGGDRQTLLRSQYITCGPHGYSEEDFFYDISIISLWELMSPGAWPVWTQCA